MFGQKKVCCKGKSKVIELDKDLKKLLFPPETYVEHRSEERVQEIDRDIEEGIKVLMIEAGKAMDKTRKTLGNLQRNLEKYGKILAV